MNEPGVVGIKYLAASEYGSKRGRPHYHILFFGLPLDDLRPTGELNHMQQSYFVSPLIAKMWPAGIHVIGAVSYESAGYVARYTLKKQTKLDYDLLNVEPERLRMSKGIGLDYFLANKDEIYKKRFIYVNTEKGTHRVSPPAYYNRKLREADPAAYFKYNRVNQKLAKRHEDLQRSQTGKTNTQL